MHSILSLKYLGKYIQHTTCSPYDLSQILYFSTWGLVTPPSLLTVEWPSCRVLFGPQPKIQTNFQLWEHDSKRYTRVICLCRASLSSVWWVYFRQTEFAIYWYTGDPALLRKSMSTLAFHHRNPPSPLLASFLSTLPVSLGSSPLQNVTDRQTNRQTNGQTFLF